MNVSNKLYGNMQLLAVLSFIKDIQMTFLLSMLLANVISAHVADVDPFLMDWKNLCSKSSSMHIAYRYVGKPSKGKPQSYDAECIKDGSRRLVKLTGRLGGKSESDEVISVNDDYIFKIVFNNNTGKRVIAELMKNDEANMKLTQDYYRKFDQYSMHPGLCIGVTNIDEFFKSHVKSSSIELRGNINVITFTADGTDKAKITKGILTIPQGNMSMPSKIEFASNSDSLNYTITIVYEKEDSLNMSVKSASTKYVNNGFSINAKSDYVNAVNQSKNKLVYELEYYGIDNPLMKSAQASSSIVYLWISAAGAIFIIMAIMMTKKRSSMNN